MQQSYSAKSDSVTQIAYSVGFNSLSYFNNVSGNNLVQRQDSFLEKGRSLRANKFSFQVVVWVASVMPCFSSSSPSASPLLYRSNEMLEPYHLPENFCGKRFTMLSYLHSMLNKWRILTALPSYHCRTAIQVFQKHSAAQQWSSGSLLWYWADAPDITSK